MIGLILFFGTCVSQVDSCYPINTFYCVYNQEKNVELYGSIIGNYCNRVVDNIIKSEKEGIRQKRRIQRLKSQVLRLKKKLN